MERRSLNFVSSSFAASAAHAIAATAPLVIASASFSRISPPIRRSLSSTTPQSYAAVWDQVHLLPPELVLASPQHASPVRTRTSPYPATHINRRFGNRLRALRKEKNFTQLRMAVDFGVDRTFISDLECGHKGVSLPTLEIFALGLNLSLSDLLNGL